MIGFRLPVTLKRQGEVIGEDAHGNDVYGPSINETYYGHAQPLTSEERVAEGLASTVTAQRVYLPPQASALTAADRLTIDGVVWEVIGNPQVHRVGAHIHHLTAVTKRYGV